MLLKRSSVLVGSVAVAVGLALTQPLTAAAQPGGDTLVTVGSPTTPFPQNKQNEPAVAIDAHAPTVLVAGANDEIDLAPCRGTDCPFTPGVGLSGVYFSFDGGASWVQPTYTGWTARTGTPGVGPIGTLPWYYENGLVSGGDPAVAFGPRLVNGQFSWANGSRLYYANLASNFSSGAFRGAEALAVSRTDDPQAAAAGDKDAWLPPVIVSRQNSALFSDKEQVWADNAASSPFFGNVYICNVAFRSRGSGAPEPVMVARSTDAGSTWTQRQISEATNNGQTGGRQGCSLRTDSRGVLYVSWLGTDIQTRSSAHFLARSFDGGRTFTRAQLVTLVNGPGAVDPVQGRFVLDGNAGARADLAPAPSIDIANGAPTGTAAPNTIVDTWNDGDRDVSRALVISSGDGGQTWTAPSDATEGADRAMYSAIAISPHGSDVYLVYDAFLQGFQTTTAAPRLMQGVMRHANVTGSTVGAWGTLHRGAVGDARGSSANSLVAEFLGDYNYAAATDTYGTAVWNDVRRAADCPAIDAYRQALITAALSTGGPLVSGKDDGEAPTEALGDRPAPLADCPPGFGNSDIYGGSYDDPTP